MSGICGIIRFDGGPVSRAELERMAARAAYRGRQGIHYHCEGSVGVACLSLDTTPDGTGACRALVGGGGRVVFAADARLDNRSECVAGQAAEVAIEAGGSGQAAPADAAAAGSGATDGQVMLGALLHYGEQGPERLIGDFAYALWDYRLGELRLARDALGMRALYYRVEPNRVLFATEVKQILTAEGVPRRLNEHAVAWHLAGMQTPPGCVFYHGIDEVKPAEEVVVGARGGAAAAVRRRIFWRPDPRRRIRYRHDAEYAEHLRELLVEAVRCRLRARSPVGVSLSGGMDSASIASVAGRLREQGERVAAMRAYSWVFNELPQCDERENSRRVAERYRIPTAEIPAEETRPLSDYPEHAPHEDDPFLLIYQALIDRALLEAAAEGAALMFSGNRGDMMCGDMVPDVPGLLRSGLTAEARSELAWLSGVHGLSRLRTIAHYLVRPLAGSLIPRRAIVSARRAAGSLKQALGRLHGSGGSAGAAVRAGPAGKAEAHVLDSFLKRACLPARDPLELEADAWALPAARRRYLLVFAPFVMRVSTCEERNNARFGLGFADPWSDRRIAEFVLACPQHRITRGVELKRLPRRAMQGIMPAEAISAARKVSPEPLYLQALRRDAYHTAAELMTDSRCAQLGYIDESALRARFERFVRGEAPMFDLWSTLSLEMWLRRYWP